MKQLLKIYFMYFLKFILKVFWLFPLHENSVIFMTNDGSSFSCNPKYIYEYMKKTYGHAIEYLWVLNNKGDLLDKVKTVKFRSFAFVINMLTSKVIVTNNGIPQYLPFRKNQILINTWHGGGAYKRCRLNNISRLGKKLEIQAWKRYDIFLSTNYFFNHCFHESLSIDQSVFWNIGMPRNDMFKSWNLDKANRIKEKLGLNKEKLVVLYAPTFRDNVHVDFSHDLTKNHEKVLKKIEDKLGGTWIFSIRFHPLRKNRCYGNILDFTNYPDMQELLYIADVLITDFSSCMWDFSLMNKPCFIYAEDLKDYIDNRGLYVDMNALPFSIADNIDILIDNINNFNKEDYQKRIKLHHEQLKITETFEAAKLTGERIASYCKGGDALERLSQHNYTNL